MATHSSFLAWRIQWTERSLCGYSPRRFKYLDMIEQLSTQKKNLVLKIKIISISHGSVSSLGL